jgi:hypothetical protein
LNNSPHGFSFSTFSHMNFIFAPLYILRSNFVFKASNVWVIYFEGFYLVKNITHNVD